MLVRRDGPGHFSEKAMHAYRLWETLCRGWPKELGGKVFAPEGKMCKNLNDQLKEGEPCLHVNMYRQLASVRIPPSPPTVLAE